MKKGWVVVTSLFIIIVLGVVVLVFIPGPKVANAPTTAGIPDLISVTVPIKNQSITSPLAIAGSARGTWYFEASAPVELRDAGGTVIAQSHIEAQSDWMTTDFVPFAATLTFPAQPAGSTGTLVLKNDNPSGDPAKQQELDIAVTF